MIRRLAFALALGLLVTTAAHAAKPATITITPVPISPTYGQTLAWQINDDAGYVSVRCTQSGRLVLDKPWAWWYPHYGYLAPIELTTNLFADDGTALSCIAVYDDVVGSRNSPGVNCSFYPPVPACLRLKRVAEVAFAVTR